MYRGAGCSDITPEADNRDVKQGSGAAVRKR